MTHRSPVVFLIDVDNTLLDNDRIAADLRRHLEREVGHERQERYWALFEELRAELGYADCLGALQRYRIEHPHDPSLLTVSAFLIDYPFVNRLYPNSLEVLERLRTWGPTIILSDGDAVFQPRKVERSGIYKAVNGNVLIYIHKERELDDVEQRYPAEHYLLVDDKLRIVTAVKQVWGIASPPSFRGRDTTRMTRRRSYPPADISVERIGDLLEHDLPSLLASGASAVTSDCRKRSCV
jgi:FMN phosphatase YigB (HAD superfamily)